MSPTAGQPAGRAHSDELIALVRHVAAADRQDFARLYQALAPVIRADLRAALPDPAESAAITSATFVEVWWLARFHTAPGTDVSAWITGIAIRRAGERLLGGGEPVAAAGDRAPPAPRRSPCAIQASHDRRNDLALTVLLHQHISAGRRARQRAVSTSRVFVT
jgi:DNA-directed RNA polymerase specialized sigma24 family protein